MGDVGLLLALLLASDSHRTVGMLREAHIQLPRRGTVPSVVTDPSFRDQRGLSLPSSEGQGECWVVGRV